MRLTAETVWVRLKMIPAPEFNTTSDKYDVASAEWSNDKDVGIGDTPKITVWLEPNYSSNGEYDYRFRSSYSSGNVNISGGEYVSAKKSGSDLKVVLRVKGVSTYEAPENAEWGSGKGKATWKSRMILRTLRCNSVQRFYRSKEAGKNTAEPPTISIPI